MLLIQTVIRRGRVGKHVYLSFYPIVTYWRSNNKQSDVDLSLALYLHLQLIDESVKITFFHI